MQEKLKLFEKTDADSNHNPNPETIAAFQEGKKIARDPNALGYRSIEELKVALEL